MLTNRLVLKASYTFCSQFVPVQTADETSSKDVDDDKDRDKKKI